MALDPVFQTIQNAIAPHSERWGWTPLERPLSLDLFRSWLEKKYQGNMTYLEESYNEREQPQRLMAQARSALVVAFNYLPHPNQAPEGTLPKHLKIARYARGRDYHRWIQNHLKEIIQTLKDAFPQDEFMSFADTSPILERDLAARAGLGWIGKNTCLIHQKQGSFFLVGEIYTSLQVVASVNLAPDRCGTCTRCLEACPTGALIEPRVLDARKCISYLTIENREPPAEPLRSQFSGWYFGCDICQEVCPWNRPFLKAEGLSPTTLSRENFSKDSKENSIEENSSRENLRREIEDILTSSNKKLDHRFRGTALSRSRAWMHKRNAIIVAVHHNMTESKGIIESCQREPQLAEIVAWALKRL